MSLLTSVALESLDASQLLDISKQDLVGLAAFYGIYTTHIAIIMIQLHNTLSSICFTYVLDENQDGLLDYAEFEPLIIDTCTKMAEHLLPTFVSQFQSNFPHLPPYHSEGLETKISNKLSALNPNAIAARIWEELMEIKFAEEAGFDLSKLSDKDKKRHLSNLSTASIDSSSSPPAITRVASLPITGANANAVGASGAPSSTPPQGTPGASQGHSRAPTSLQGGTSSLTNMTCIAPKHLVHLNALFEKHLLNDLYTFIAGLCSRQQMQQLDRI